MKAIQSTTEVDNSINPKTSNDTVQFEQLFNFRSGEFNTRGEMHLQRLTYSQLGTAVHVDMEITIQPEHVRSEDILSSQLKSSCEPYVKEALATLHSKTLVSSIQNEDGIQIGDIVASFNSLPRQE